LLELRVQLPGTFVDKSRTIGGSECKHLLRLCILQMMNSDLRNFETCPSPEGDKVFEEFVSELVFRLLVPAMKDFEDTWRAANDVCDRYQLGKYAA
jgi:hypothetical protein